MSRSGECQVFFRERVLCLEKVLPFIAGDERRVDERKRGKSWKTVNVTNEREIEMQAESGEIL
jgi:hypothetical protein